MSGPMNFVYPVPGDTTNVWGTALNTLLGLAENHDHTSGKGVQVPTAGLAIDADLTFNSFAAIALKAVAFTEVTAASMASYTDALFVSSADHNLWFMNSAGTAVQITEGDTLNLSLVGGIGGDYAAVNALLSYDDATHRYLFQQEGSPRPWAGVAAGNVDIYEQAASIANRVRLKSPSALGASYDVTWPTGLPGSQVLIQMTASGQLIASNTLPIGAYVAHSTYVRTLPVLPVSAWQVASGSPPAYGNPGVDSTVSIPASSDVYYPIMLKDTRERVQRVVVWGESGGGVTTLSLDQANQLGGAFSGIAGATGVSIPNTGIFAANNLIPTTPFQNSDGQTLWLHFTTPATTICKITAIDVWTDVP